MCYNSDCRIKINSVIDGVKNNLFFEGKVINAPSGMKFCYSLDGDECELSMDGDKIVQQRRGQQNIKMTFRKGEETECYLESGGFSGSFSVFTNDLQCTMRDIDCEFGINKTFILTIVYTLGEQKTKLNFSAEYIL